MSDLTRQMIDDIRPKGPAHDPAPDGDLDLLLEGMADNYEVVRAFVSTLSDIRDPKKTPVLSDLEAEYGIPVSTILSEADRRLRLDEFAYGGDSDGTEDDLQAALRNAGFDVYVYQNDPAVDPAIFLEQQFQMVANGFNAYAGRDDAFAGRIGGELLVNGEVFKTSKVFTSVAGTFYAGDGTGAGEYQELLVEKIEYPIPTDPADWPMVYFVGGAATYGFIELLENGGFEVGNFNDWVQNNSTLEGYNGYTQWAATTAYSLGDFRVPTTDNGFKYEVTTAGTSGGTEPTWPTTPGNTVVDGTVTWTCREFNTATGNYAAKLVAAGSDIEGAETVSYEVHPYRTYTIKVRNDVTAYTAGNYKNVLEFRDADDLLISSVTLLDKTAVTTGYEQIVKTIGRAGTGADFDIPPTARKIRIGHEWDGTPTGTAYMDDVEFYRSDKQSITEIDNATVDGSREDEFKRTILKYGPMHAWAALIVTFA